MNRNQLGAVLGVVAVVVVAAVILLATGGSDDVKPPPEKTGDVIPIPGENPPTETALADIEFAEVRREGDALVFEARLGAEIPNKLKGLSFDLRWDIEASDESTFILSGNLDVGPNVSLVGTSNNFGSSSLDDTLPGEVEITGNTWIIRLTPTDVPDWPDDFTWRLSTSLDGEPGDPKSGRAEDAAPDAGFAEVKEV